MLLLVVLAVVGAACGGDAEADRGVASIEDLSTVTTSTVGEAPASDELVMDEEAVLAFAACMREGGIDFPDPVVDSDGNVGFDLVAMRALTDVDETELEAAFESCVALLAGVSFGFERIFETEFQDDLVAFSVCMRENGFDMPDPDFSALTSSGRLYPNDIDPDDPDFETAFEACQDALPGIPGISSP